MPEIGGYWSVRLSPVLFYGNLHLQLYLLLSLTG